MIALRNYQIRVRDALVACRRGIAKAPAGSGKTIMGAAALDRWAGARARLARRRMRVALVANTIEQCGQWERAFAAFPGLEQTTERRVVCYASGLALGGYDLVIMDECHHVAAPEYRRMLEGHAGVRWGLSATPERADDARRDVFDLIGDIVVEVDRRELEAAGQLALARVVMHQPNEPKELEKMVEDVARPMFDERARRMRAYLKGAWDDREQMNRCIWQVAQDIAINFNGPRNDRIVSIAGEHAQDSTIILIGKIEHGEALRGRIPGSVVVHSQMRKRVSGYSRREALEAFGAGESRTIIATSLADEGLDVPRANVLILAAGGRSSAKAEQRTGRVLRTFKDKTHGVIHDFNDVQHYFLWAQSKARVRLYRSLGYEITEAGVLV